MPDAMETGDETSKEAELLPGTPRPRGSRDASVGARGSRSPRISQSGRKKAQARKCRKAQRK